MSSAGKGSRGWQIDGSFFIDSRKECHNSLCTEKTKCRTFETNIPRKGISGSQSQFPHSCICERIIYFHDGSAVSAGGNMWTDPGNT
jgi:hypothetical protein